MTSDQPSYRIDVDAAKQDDHIESVTVFQCKRAEIKRRVDVKLEEGQNHIHIERLPSCIEEDSIRVEGTGIATIFDVVYHKPASVLDKVEVTTATALRQIQALQKERDVSREQTKFLSAYGRALDSKNLTAEAVQQFLDMFGPRQIAIGKRIQELDVHITAAEKELSRVQSEMYADTYGQKRATKITVMVLAETSGPAKLVLRCTVSDASWTPLYDVRASIANDPGESSTVALHYRASITQSTGENWSDVALTLSTASPQLGTNMPELESWTIGPPPPPSFRYAKTLGFGFTFGGGGHKSKSSYASNMGVRKAHVSHAGILSTSFAIPGRSDIPSDGGNHKVVITILDLKTELEWICMPRKNESVYLKSKVVNTSEFTLLPGEASVFMDENFVSKSRIQSQRIAIRNTRLTPVSSLKVLDHIPVSIDAHVKVNLVSPQRLEPIVAGKEQPWADIQKGVKARWAPRHVGGEGIVEWDCEITPTDEVELELAWEVSAPVDKFWKAL